MADNSRASPETVFNVYVGGMHCVNCPALIEGRLRAVPGVHEVEARYPEGTARVTGSSDLTISALHQAVVKDGYSVSETPPSNRLDLRKLAEIGGTFVALIALGFILQQLHLLPQGFGISEQMSYGLVFVIGLVASVSSCLAVTGGLMVALAAEYNEANERLSDQQRVAPLLYFNVGRLISYTLLGGLIGTLGSALTLSAPVTGALTLLAAVVMILLGLHMLRLIPSPAQFMPGLSRSFIGRMQNAASSGTKSAAFGLGALTFFLPCGFTQALQIYVLGKASFTEGALTMLAFALGTLPALISLSAISSLARGNFQKHFMRIAGAAVVLLGILNIQSGFVLTNQGSTANSAAAPQAASAFAGTTGEVQRISMRVIGFGYEPNQFTVKVGKPVEWVIDGSDAEGCGRILVAPRLGVRKILSDTSTTLITFTPTRTGEFPFNCSMGMMTPASKITVIADDKG